MQLQVYAMEKRTKTPEKYYFPNFETIHWYVAEFMIDELKKYRPNKEGEIDTTPLYLLRGARTLLAAIQAWNRQKSQLETVPFSIDSTTLLLSFVKLMKFWEESDNEGGGNVGVEMLKTHGAPSGGGPRRKRPKKSNHFIY